jgi:hypothetical protein
MSLISLVYMLYRVSIKSYHLNIITTNNAYRLNDFASKNPMSEVRRRKNGDKRREEQ